MSASCDRVRCVHTMVDSRRSRCSERRWRTLRLTCAVLGVVWWCSGSAVLAQSVTETPGHPLYQYSGGSAGTDPPSVTELTNGMIAKKQRLERSLSPFLVREDIVVEPEGELIIDPGVELRFAPMVGITVKGVLTAMVSVVYNRLHYVNTFVKINIFKEISF